MAPIGRDRRAADDSRARSRPKFGGHSVGEFPDALAARACGCDIQEIIRTQARREPGAGRQRDAHGSRDAERANRRSALARAFAWDWRPWPPDGGRRRSPPATSYRSSAGAQSVRDTAFDIHAVKPRSRPVRIGGQVHERPPIQEHRMTHASVVRRDPLGRTAVGADAPDVQLIGQRTLDEVDEPAVGRPQRKVTVEAGRSREDATCPRIAGWRQSRTSDLLVRACGTRVVRRQATNRTRRCLRGTASARPRASTPPRCRSPRLAIHPACEPRT